MNRFLCLALLPLLVSGCYLRAGNISNGKSPPAGVSTGGEAVLKFGIIADVQYCDCDSSGSRHYRYALQKLDECVEALNAARVQFTVNLGDLVDRDSQHNLAPVLSRLKRLHTPVYNLTGNHDYGGVTDNESLFGRLGMPGGYYSFSRDGWRFVMLDTNDISEYAADTPEKEAELAVMRRKMELVGRPYAPYNGGVGRRQMRWLERELKKARRASEKVLVFSHHPLYGVEGLTALNDSEIVSLMSKYGAIVKGVFSGHHHAGAFGVDGGIPYITVEGMIETSDTNAYGIVTIYPDRIELEGVGRTTSRTIP